MSGASFRYLVKEGFRNTWTNRMMSIASICVLLSCLVLIGSASMMAAGVASIVAVYPDQADVVLAYAGAANLMTTILGIYFALFVSLPVMVWVYEKITGDRREPAAK